MMLARRRFRPASWVLVVFVLGLQLALVPPARACSCMMPGPMADYRGDPNAAIFTAIVEGRDARGYPATVTRWFQGGPFERRVWFDAAAFSGDGASCGIAPLPVLTEWIFVAYRIEGRQELGTGLCSPHAPLGGPDGQTGQAMLADALRTFGGSAPIVSEPPPDVGEPPGVGPTGSAAGGILSDMIVPIAVVVLASLGLVVGLRGVLARLRPTED